MCVAVCYAANPTHTHLLVLLLVQWGRRHVLWKLFNVNYVVCVYLCGGMCMCPTAHAYVKRPPFPLELTFGAVVRCPMWMLETESQVGS